MYLSMSDISISIHSRSGVFGGRRGQSPPTVKIVETLSQWRIDSMYHGQRSTGKLDKNSHFTYFATKLRKFAERCRRQTPCRLAQNVRLRKRSSVHHCTHVTFTCTRKISEVWCLCASMIKYMHFGKRKPKDKVGVNICCNTRVHCTILTTCSSLNLCTIKRRWYNFPYRAAKTDCAYCTYTGRRL